MQLTAIVVRACDSDRVLKVQAKQIGELQKVVKKSEESRTDFEDVTIQVRNLWAQLCDDLSLLARKALGQLVRSAKVSKKSMGHLSCPLNLNLSEHYSRHIALVNLRWTYNGSCTEVGCARAFAPSKTSCLSP
jgi:hypothetical protein